MFLIDEPFKKEIRVMFPEDKHPPEEIVVPLPVQMGSRLRRLDEFGSWKSDPPVMVYHLMGRAGPNSLFLYRMEGVQ